MVTEDYVSFETAKLLKEKGFNELTPLSYSLPYGHESHIPCSNDVDTDFVSRITLQMAMKWLRLEHKLHIEPIPDCFDYKHVDIHDGWYCEITHLSDMSYDADYDSHKKHKTYEGACEDAIKFCLENLI